MGDNWEFNCPQYVDFDNIEELDQGDTEAFFETCKLDSGNGGEESDSKKKKRLQSFKCSVEYRSTIAASTQTSVSTCNDAAVEGEVGPQPPPESTLAVEGRKILTARRTSQRLSEKCSQKPPEDNQIKMPVTKPNKTVAKPNKIVAKGVKRNISFASVRPLKKKPPCPPSPGAPLKCKVKKFTCPTTPKCLQRSMRKKVLKSSEEIELEKIAEMRKKVDMQIKTNQVTMKKIIRPPALKPLPREVQEQNIPPKNNPVKKVSFAISKVPEMDFVSKLPETPFRFKAPKLPNNVAEVAKGNELSLMSSPGLHRCSTPYSTKRRSSILRKKIPAAGLRSTKQSGVLVKKKMPSESSKPGPSIAATAVQKKWNIAPSSRQMSAVKEDKLSAKNIKNVAIQKKTEDKLIHQTRTNVKDKDALLSLKKEVSKGLKCEASNKLLPKNKKITLPSKSERAALHNKNEKPEKVSSRLVKPLVPKSQMHSGLPFIRKQKNLSSSVILSGSFDSSDMNDVDRATSSMNRSIKKDLQNLEQASQEKEGTESTENIPVDLQNEILESPPEGQEVFVPATVDAKNPIICAADKKASAWRRKIEGELEQQKKLLLKSSKPRLLRSTTSAQKPLADITTKYHNKPREVHGRVLRRSLTDMPMKKKILMNSTSKN